MHLIANQETIDRLVVQGVLLLQAFHAKHYNDPKGNESEFLRGSFAGWRSALHTEYRAGAEEIGQLPVALEGQRIFALGAVQRHRRHAVIHLQQEVVGRIQRQWQRDGIGWLAHGIFLVSNLRAIHASRPLRLRPR